MRPTFLIAICGLLLAACQPQPDIPNIQANQTYKGYPCFNECADFQLGYDQATKGKFVEKSQCDNLDTKQQLGCQAYLNDLHTDVVENGGLFIKP